MKEDDVVVVSSDSEEDEEHVWIRKSSNPQYQILLEKIKPILFYQVQPGHKPSDGFPYAKFQEFAKDFKKSLALVNVKSTRAFIWKNLLRWLVSMKLCFDSVADIIDDKNYNLILTDFMAQYVDYKCQLHSSITDANEAGRISNEIVIILSLIFNGWVPGILMTLLKIQVVDEYRLILFPIFKKYLSKQHVHGTLDLISYLRLILCFRKWKKLTHFKEDKELINEIAVGKSPKALRSDLIDLSSDSTDNDPVLPKTVPPVDKNNRGFFNLTGLIGFAAKNQFGTRILLINRTLELEDTVEEFFKRYYEYINRDAPKLPDWSRVDLRPVLVEDLTRSTSPIQHPPQSTASSATTHTTSQTANKNKGIQGTKAVDQHLSSDCDKPKLSISNKNNNNLNSHNIENLSRSYKNSPHNRNNNVELGSKLKDVVELDDSDSDKDNDTTNKSTTENVNVNVKAFAKRLTANLDKLKERAVTIDNLINRVNSNVSERVQNPEVVEILIDDEEDTDTVSAAQQEVAIAEPPNPPISMPVPPPPLPIEKPASERKRCEHGIVSSTTSFDCSNTPDGLANSELHDTTRDVSTPISDDDGGFGVPNRFSILQRSSSKVVEEATSSTNEIPKRTQSSGVVVFSLNASQPRRSISSSPCSTRPSSPSPDRCPANIFPSSTIRSRSINRPAAGTSISRPLSSLSNREQPTCSGGCVPKPVPAAKPEDQSLEEPQLNHEKQVSAPIESSKNQDSPTCSRFVLTRDASATPSIRSTETSPGKSTDSNEEATTFEVSDLLMNISGFIGDSQEAYGGFESPQERNGPDKSPRKIYNTSVSIENEPNDNASFDVIFPQRNDDDSAKTLSSENISFHTEAKKQNQHLETNDKSSSQNDNSQCLQTSASVENPKAEQNQHNKDAQESPYHETDLEDPQPKEDIFERDKRVGEESISSPLKTEKTTDQIETVKVIQQEVSPNSNESKEACANESVEKEVLFPSTDNSNEQDQLNNSSAIDDAYKKDAKAVFIAVSDEDSSSIDLSGELIEDDIESPDYELIAPKQKSKDLDTSSSSVEDDKNTQQPSEVPSDKKTSISSNEITKTNEDKAFEVETIVSGRDVDSTVIDRQKVEQQNNDSENKAQGQKTVGDNLKDRESGASTSTHINKIVNYDHDYVTASNTKNDQSKPFDTKSNAEGSNSVNKILETFIGSSSSTKNERDVIRKLKNLEGDWSSIDSSNDPGEQIIEELTYIYDAILMESEMVAENFTDNISKQASEEESLEIQSIASAVENLPDNILKQASEEENQSIASALENLPHNISKQTSEEESCENQTNASVECSLNLNEVVDEKDVEVQQLFDGPKLPNEVKSDETVEKPSSDVKENDESEAMSVDVIPDDTESLKTSEKIDTEVAQMNQPTGDDGKETPEKQFDATDEKSHEKEISFDEISLSTISDEEIPEYFDLLSKEALPDQKVTFESVEDVSPVSNESKTDNDTLPLSAQEDFDKKADNNALVDGSAKTTTTETDKNYEPPEVPQEKEDGLMIPSKSDNEKNEGPVNGSQDLVEQPNSECQMSETEKDYEPPGVPQEEEEGLMIPSKDVNEEKVVEKPSNEGQLSKTEKDCEPPETLRKCDNVENEEPVNRSQDLVEQPSNECQMSETDKDYEPPEVPQEEEERLMIPREDVNEEKVVEKPSNEGQLSKTEKDCEPPETLRKCDNVENEEPVNRSQDLVEQPSNECQMSETDKAYEPPEVPQEEEERLMIPREDVNEEKVVEQPSDECQMNVDPSIDAASSDNTKTLSKSGEEDEQIEQTPVEVESSPEIKSKSQARPIPEENKKSIAEADPILSKEASDVEDGPGNEKLIPESESAQISDANLVETEISNQIPDTKNASTHESNDNSDITSETVENSSKQNLITETPQEMINSVDLLPSSVINDFASESTEAQLKDKAASPCVVSSASTEPTDTINKIVPMRMLRVRIPRLPKKELLKISQKNLEHPKCADNSVKQEVIVVPSTPLGNMLEDNKPSEKVKEDRVDLSVTHQGTSEKIVVEVKNVQKDVKNEVKIEELEQERKAALIGPEPTNIVSEHIPLQQQAKKKKQSVKNKKVKKHKLKIEQTDDGQTDVQLDVSKPEKLTNLKSIPLTDNYEETAKLNEPEQVQANISSELVTKAQCIEKSQGDEDQDPDKTPPQKKKVLRVRVVKLPTDDKGSTDDLRVCPSSSAESIPQIVQKSKVNRKEAKPKSHSIEQILATDTKDVPVNNEDQTKSSADKKRPPSIALNPNEPTEPVINELEQISVTKTEENILESKPKLSGKSADKETLENIYEKVITSKGKTEIVKTDKEKDSLPSTSSEIEVKEELTIKKTKTPPLPNSKPTQSKNSIKKSATSKIAKSVECQTEPKQAITYKRPPSIDPTKQPIVIQNIIQRKDELIRTRNQEVFTEIRHKDHENTIEPDSRQEVAKELQRTETTVLEDESILSTKVQVGDLEEPSIISDSEMKNNSPVRLESDSAVVFYQFRDTIDEEVLGITSQDSNQTPPYYNDENGTPVMDEKNLNEEETTPQKITCLSAIKVPTTELPEITSNVILREPKLIVPARSPSSSASIEAVDESVRSFSTIEDENLEVWNQQLPLSGQYSPSPSCTPKSSLCNPKNRKQKNPRKVRFLLKRDDKSLRTGDDKSFSSEDLNAAAILTSFKNFAVINPATKVPKSRKKGQPTRITRSTRTKNREPQPTITEIICSSDILDSSKAFEKRLISPTIEHQIDLRQSNSSSDSEDAGKLVIDLDAKRSTKPKSLEQPKKKAKASKNKKRKVGRKASCSKKLAKTDKLSLDPLNIVNDLDVVPSKPTELASTEKRFQLKPSSISYKSKSMNNIRHKLNKDKETWLKNLSLRKTSKSLDSESEEMLRGDSILKRSLSEPVMPYHCHEALESFNLFSRKTDNATTSIEQSESAVKESLEKFAKVVDDSKDPLSLTKDSEETEKPKLVLHIRRLPTPTGDNFLEANLKPAKKHTKKTKRKKAELAALEDQTTFEAVLVEDPKPVDEKSKRTKTELEPVAAKEEDKAVQIKKAATSGKAKSNDPKICQLEEGTMFETVFIENSTPKTTNCEKPIAKSSSKNQKASKVSEEEVLKTKSLSKKSKVIHKCSQKAKKLNSKITEAIVSESSVTAPKKPTSEVEEDKKLTQAEPLEDAKQLVKTKAELKQIVQPVKETAKKPKSKNTKSETKSVAKSINKTLNVDSGVEIAEEPKIDCTLVKEVKSERLSEPPEEVKPKESVKLVPKLKKSSNEPKAKVEKSKSTSNVEIVEVSKFDDVTIKKEVIEDPQEVEKVAEEEPRPTKSKKATSELKLITKKATTENETAVEKSISNKERNIETEMKANAKSAKEDTKVEIVEKANDVDVPSKVVKSDEISEASQKVKTEISKEIKPIYRLLKRATLGLRLNANPIKKSPKEAKAVLDKSKTIKKTTENSKSAVKTLASVEIVDESKIVSNRINKVKSHVLSEPTQEVKVEEEMRSTSPVLNKANLESKLPVKSILKSSKEPEAIIKKSESKSVSTPIMADVEIVEVSKIVATPSKKPQQVRIGKPPVDEKAEDLAADSPKKPIHVEIVEESKKVISPSKKVKSVTFSEEVKLIAKSNKTETVIDNLKASEKPTKIVKSALKSTLKMVKVVSESFQELKKDAIEESQVKVLVGSNLTDDPRLKIAKLEVDAVLTKPVSECPKTDAVEVSDATSDSLKKEENIDVHDEAPVKIENSVPKITEEQPISNEKDLKPLKDLQPSETALSTEEKSSLSDKTNLESEKAQETESSGTSVLDEDANQVILTTKKAIDELVSLMKSTNEPKNPIITEELVDEVVPFVDPVKNATLEEKPVTSTQLEEEKSDSSINHNVVSETKATISIEQTFMPTEKGSIKIDKILDELVASGSCPASISADTDLSNTTTTVTVEPAPITPIDSTSVSSVDFEPLCVPFSKALDSPIKASPKNDEQISTDTIETPTKKEDEVKRALDISISKIFGSKLTDTTIDIENNVDSEELDKKDNNNDRLKKSVQRATKRKRPSLDGDQSQVNFTSGFQRRRSNSTSDMTSIVPTTESIEGFEIDSEILPNKSADSEAKKAQLLIDSLEFERESLFFELNAANQVPLNSSTKVEQRQIENDKKPEQFGFVEHPLRQGTSVKASDCMLSGNRGQDDEDKLRSFYMNECQWGEVHNFESPDEHELDDLFDGFCLPLQTPLIPGSENVSAGTSKIDKNSNFTLTDIDAIINLKKSENSSGIVDVQLALATEGVISLNQKGISTGHPSEELERESTLPEILVNEDKPQQSDVLTKPSTEEPTTTGSSPLAKAFTKKIMASLELTNKLEKTPEKDGLAKEATSESKMKCRSTPFWKQINKNPDNCLDEIFEVNSTKNSSTSPGATESDSKVVETISDKTETSKTTVSKDLSTDDLFNRLKNETPINNCAQIKPKSKEKRENSTSELCLDTNSQSSSMSTSSISQHNESKKSIPEKISKVTATPALEKKAEADVNPEYYNPYAKKPSRQSHITKSKPITEEVKSKHKGQTSKSEKTSSSASIKPSSQSSSLQKLSPSTAPELKKSLSTVVQVPVPSEKITKPTGTVVRPSLKRSLSDDKKLQEPPSKVMCTKIPASVPIQEQTLKKSELSLPLVTKQPEPSNANVDSVAKIKKKFPQPQPIVVHSAKSDPSPVIQKKLSPAQQTANQSNSIVPVQKILDPLQKKPDDYTKSSTPVLVPPTPPHPKQKLTLGTPGLSNTPSPNSSSSARSLQTGNPLHQKPDQYTKSSTPVQVPPTPPHLKQKRTLGTPGLSNTPSPNSSSSFRSLQTGNPLHQKPDQCTKSSTPVQVPLTPPHPKQTTFETNKLTLGTPGLSKSSTPVQVSPLPPHPIPKLTLGTSGLGKSPSPNSSSSVRSLQTGNPLHQKPDQCTKSSTLLQVPSTSPHPNPKLNLGTPGLSVRPLQTSFSKTPSSKPLTSPSPQSQNHSSHSPMNSSNPISEHPKHKPVPAQKTNFPNQQKLPTPIPGTPSSTPTSFGPSRSKHQSSSTARTPSTVTSLPKVMAYPSTVPTPMSPVEQDLARVRTELKKIQDEVSRLPKSDYNFRIYRQRKALLTDLENKQKELDALKQKHYYEMKKVNELKNKKDHEKQQMLKARSERGGEHQPQYHHGHHHNPHNSLKRKHNDPSADATQRTRSLHQLPSGSASAKSSHRDRTEYVNKFGELDKYKFPMAKSDSVIDEHSQAKRLPPWDPKPMNAEEIIQTLLTKRALNKVCPDIHNKVQV